MAIHAAGTEGRAVTAYQPKLPDAEILQQVIRKSICTSSEAFLKTVEQVDRSAPDYWEREIDSATWAVIQQGEDVVGVAVARPDPEKHPDIVHASRRFIESVWIDPELRGGHLGERLVRFLFAVEYTKSPDVWQFLLWVFEKNVSAIRLYERMKFECIGSQEVPDGSGRIELKYRYSLKPDAAEMAATAESWQKDLDKYGVIYRVLGDREASYSSLRYFKESSTDSQCGSVVR